MTAQVVSQETVCQILAETDLSSWDCFVEQQPQASVYHLSVWRRILYDAFGKHWYLVGARRDGVICAGLPLVHMKSRLFGNFLVSMPYFNYGGVLAADSTLAGPLLQQAVQLGRRLGAKHLELRHLENYFPELPVGTDKVSMWLPLPTTVEELFTSFKSKLRSQVRKAEKNGLGVQIGRMELLEDFYTVFAHNMRALGTPVYGKKFFRLILEAFPQTACVVVVTGKEQQPLAGGFLLGYRDRLEIPWASSLREYNHLQSNMWLYWACLKYGCEQGYRLFDFGRSTIDSPTFNFKKQWGAQPVPQHWHYHLETGGEMPRLNPQNPKYQFAINVWKRLPLGLTRLLGPSIVKHIP